MLASQLSRHVMYLESITNRTSETRNRYVIIVFIAKYGFIIWCKQNYVSTVVANCLYAHSHVIFGIYFATREINANITLSSPHKPFAIPVHTSISTPYLNRNAIVSHTWIFNEITPRLYYGNLDRNHLNMFFEDIFLSDIYQVSLCIRPLYSIRQMEITWLLRNSKQTFMLMIQIR